MQPYYIPIVAALIVLAGLAVGFRDVAGFRFRRVRAIAGVCFTESVRRRILWITPLAIVGIVAVSLLTRPQDEQDAIRQTVKYSLFASSLVVIIAAVLLAATNLPKEIENRVIFTIVTKPTSRLEIVLGKIMGFAQVSALILLIMGLFTWGYLRIRAAALESQISASLKSGAADPASELALKEYVRSGLLSTRSFAWPQSLEIYSRIPAAEGPRWMNGGGTQYYTLPFSLDDQARRKIVPTSGPPKFPFLMADVLIDHHQPNAHELEELKSAARAIEGAAASLVAGPVFSAPTTAPAAEPVYIPQVAFQALDAKNKAMAEADLSLTKPINPAPLPDAPATQPTTGQPVRRIFALPLGEASINAMLENGKFTVEAAANTPSFEYGADAKSTYIALFDPVGGHRRGETPPPPEGAPADGDYMLFSPGNGGSIPGLTRIEPIHVAKGQPLGFARAGEPGKLLAVAGRRAVPVEDDSYLWLRLADRIDPAPAAPGVQSPQFLTRQGRSGMQIRGQAEADGPGSLGVFSFRNTPVGAGRDGKVGLQLKVYIDRGGDLDTSGAASSRASVQVRDVATGKVSDSLVFTPETSRLSYVGMPAEFFQGGDFDVILTGLTPGQWLGLHGPTASTPTVGVVQSETGFEANLFKSLFILWLLSLLVVIIAVFCSTFLSWPIAVVLTLLLLLGRWGVDQLGDSLAPGSARGVATELFGGKADPAKDKAVTAIGEAMNTALRNAATVLPDVEKFPVIEDINRGVSIPMVKLRDASWEVLLYGLPLVFMTYLIFRRKEVAP